MFWANQKGIRNPRGNLLTNWVKRPDDQKLVWMLQLLKIKTPIHDRGLIHGALKGVLDWNDLAGFANLNKYWPSSN